MEAITESTFYEVAVILGLATVLGVVGQKLKQPLLIMFLVSGVLAGPSALGVVRSYEEIELLAHMGIALLLFIVGMRLDVDLIRTTGPVALATGVGQIVFTSAIGFGIALTLGMTVISAAYVAVALTFSSTIIIVKLLSDKKEIDSLHGRIAVGFLIVQDIGAIIALVLLTTLAGPMDEDAPIWLTIGMVLVKGAGLLVGVALAARYVLPRLLGWLAHSQELLILFAIAWAVFLGALSDFLGFSKEVGAFLAGISIASTPYREGISVRLATLRDFLLLFFFIDLGARLEWGTVGAQVGNAAILSVFVLIGNPIIVLIIMGVMGYRRRTGFLAGLTVAQISEFSLIVAALGVGLGHIPDETMGLITLVGVGTIFASTYMILYSEPLYRLLATPLKIFERRKPHREAVGGGAGSDVYDVLLLGVGDYGSNLAEHLLERGKRFAVADFNPMILERWRSRGVQVIYGDLGDPDFYDSLPLGRTRWVVSTVRESKINRGIVGALKERGYEGKIALTAASSDEADAYREGGADVVLQPWTDAAEQAVGSLIQAMDVVPVGLDWPVGFREIRVPRLAVYAGKRLEALALFRKAGATVLAVSRGGRVYYEPGPEFRIYSGDRLVVMAPLERLAEVEALLYEAEESEEPDGKTGTQFESAEVLVPPGAPEVGQTLADLRFRDEHGVNVVGIARGPERLPADPHEPLQGRDVLVVIGPLDAIEQFRRQPWL